MKGAYNTIILSARGTIQLPCLRLCPRTQITHSPRTDCVRRVRCDRVPARRRRRHVVVRHRRRPAPPPAGRHHRFRGGSGGVSSLSLSFAFVLPTSSRRRPASSLSGWGKTTCPPRPPPTMCSPSTFVPPDNPPPGTVCRSWRLPRSLHRRTSWSCRA
jgi:hypothetical protein